MDDVMRRHHQSEKAAARALLRRLQVSASVKRITDIPGREPNIMTEMTDQELQQQLMEAYRAGHQEVKASSTTARLGNVLYWVFSGFAVLLLLVAVALTAIGGSSDYGALLVTSVVFGISALVSWPLGHACRYVLGGDATLWEEALIARARRSPEFRKYCVTAALLVAGGIAWLILDGRYQETLREQQYEKQLQADRRREAQQAEAERQEAREVAQRQAAIAAQEAAAKREAAAERAAVISPTDLAISDVSLDSIYATYDQARGTITNHSEQTLRYLEFEGTIKDCPLEYSADQCQVMGRQSVKLTVDIPPNQERAFIARLGSWNLPDLDPQGQRFSSWRIVTASSCSQGNLKAHQCAGKTAQ